MSSTEWIFGRNPVREALRAERRKVFEIQIASGVDPNPLLNEIIERARGLDVPVKRPSRDALDQLADGHQGVLGLVSEYPYSDLDVIMGVSDRRGEPPFLLLLDLIQDPQNLGTLVRSAEAFGVHGIVIPTKRSAGVTPSVVSASSGACEHMHIARRNLSQAIRKLKGLGVWVAGLATAPDAQAMPEVDVSGSIAVVVGNEGQGMRRLVQEHCDFLMRIPMRGEVGSLNAAVAGSIALFRVWESRKFAESRG